MTQSPGTTYWRWFAEQAHPVRVGFLQAELDLSLTLAELALTVMHPESAQRNRAHAEDGYRMALWLYAQHGAYSEEERQAIDGKLAALRRQLGELKN